MNQKEAVYQQIRHIESESCPYVLDFEVDSGLEGALDTFYGDSGWRQRRRNYIVKAPAMAESFMEADETRVPAV